MSVDRITRRSGSRAFRVRWREHGRQRTRTIDHKPFRWRRNDRVYPSQERIASMTGLSRRTVQRTLDRLAADGLIIFWSERHGSFLRNVYEIRPIFDALAVGAKRPLPML
ncbi:MAG TPA: helix-turn-helix domain-containing protein [Conexibacter sp.]|jgi:biotin operon repressor|nr:helix-turn-helix domain-containing protein [Conexibacter sp.]